MEKNDIRASLLDRFYIVLLAERGVSMLLYRVFFRLRDALLCKARWSNGAFVLTNEASV